MFLLLPGLLHALVPVWLLVVVFLALVAAAVALGGWAIEYRRHQDDLARFARTEQFCLAKAKQDEETRHECRAIMDTRWGELVALEQMEHLLGRVHTLEKTLQSAHGVKTRSSSYPLFPLWTHQDLFNLAVALRETLEQRLSSQERDLAKEVVRLTLEVEALERMHEALDDVLGSSSYEDTQRRIKQDALGAWDAVVAYAFDSSPRCLVAYYQVSLRKHGEEQKLAVKILVEKGACAQYEAVEHVSVSMKHWGFWRALRLAIAEERDTALVRQASDQFLFDVEEGVDHALQELKQALDDPSFRVDTPGQNTSLS